MAARYSSASAEVRERVAGIGHIQGCDVEHLHPAPDRSRPINSFYASIDIQRRVELQYKCPCPPIVVGGHGAFVVCSAVSYFSTLVGSIIGAGRLSFRVRDGSGRFPVAITAVTLLRCYWWWGAVWCCGWVWLRVCKFSAG